ncbi:MAG: sigma-70 family RNA polymerase sigma factor [Pirellulaceae bacterium]
MTNQTEMSTSKSLIKKAIRNDPEAWQRMVRQYSPLAYNYARHLGLAAHDSADIAQEALVAVFTCLGRFRTEKDSDGFRKWLRGIVRNKAREHLRSTFKRLDTATGGSNAQLRLSELAACDPNIDMMNAGGQQTQPYKECGPVTEIRRALTIIRGDFQESTWRAFWETAVNGMSASEVAIELKMSTVAVRKAKSRVIKRLKQELNQINSTIQDNTNH